MTRFLPFGSRSKTIQVNTLGGGAPAVTYATWNPADKGSLTLSGGDLIASIDNASWQTVRSTIGKNTGKWYWEVTITATATGWVMIGLSDGIVGVTNSFSGQNAQSMGYSVNEPKIYKDGGIVAYTPTATVGDVIGVALDMDAGEVKFSKNGTFSSVVPFSWTGPIYGTVSGQFTSNVLTANFGATPFTYSVPSGYNEGLYDTVDLTAGLVAHYPLATNSLDTSGNGYNGTDTNVTYSSGSAVFNGSTSLINTSTSTALDAGNSFTASVWVNMTAFPVLQAWNAISKLTLGSQGWMLYTDNSNKYSFFGYGLPSVLVTEANTYSLNTWYNYVIQYDGVTLKIYRDNVLVGSQASVGTITPSATDFKFGYYVTAEFNGKMKKARIYNRVLNAGEIAALYAEG